MKSYRLSNKAAGDLLDISRYTKSRFGNDQAKAYLTGLKETFLQLGHNPSLGQNLSDLRPGYRRYLFQQHAIYFRQVSSGIQIVRVLHQQMQVSLHIN